MTPGIITLQNELREEVRIYREHLAEQAREEEKRERELDALVNSEVEKQWAKRLEQWRKEREARKKLMQDVLNERKKQIEEKCECNVTIGQLLNFRVMCVSDILGKVCTCLV